MSTQHSTAAKISQARTKEAIYPNTLRGPQVGVDSELQPKSERITLNLTPDKRQLLDELRKQSGVRSIGEIMRRAFVLYENLFKRVRNGETIVLRHPEGEKTVKICTNWKEESDRDRRDGNERSVVGLRVEKALRDMVDEMISAKAAPTITELSELAMDTYELVMSHLNRAHQMLARGKTVAGEKPREYFLNPDGTTAHRSGGDIADLDPTLFRDKQEYSVDDEFVRQIVLKKIVANVQEPVYALTLDSGDYLSQFWSGPLWKTFLKTHAGHEGEVYRIFMLDAKTLEEPGMIEMIKGILDANEKIGVKCKVLFKDTTLGWPDDHDTSFLLSGDYISESYSLDKPDARPGYVVRDAGSERARELKLLWEFIDMRNKTDQRRRLDSTQVASLSK